MFYCILFDCFKIVDGLCKLRFVCFILFCCVLICIDVVCVSLYLFNYGLSIIHFLNYN